MSTNAGTAGSLKVGSVAIDGATDDGAELVGARQAFGALMGTTAHVVLRGDGAPEHDTQRCLDELGDLESRWSRFLPNSELSRLGRADGAPTKVSAVTALLVELMVIAWRRTEGLFDPSMVDLLERAGYDRSFEQLDSETPPTPAPCPAAPTVAAHLHPPLLDEVEADPRTGLVRLPSGVRLDPGGLGKGLAADLVATAACDRGATGALVSIGGDLRVAGTPPPRGWEVEIDHHRGLTARVNLRSGALATSSTLRRRWQRDGRQLHHVLDPRTGRPSTGDAVAVSVVAATAWWAEAVATAVLLAFGDASTTALLAELTEGTGVLVSDRDRRRHRFGPLGDAFELDPASDTWEVER